MLIFLLVITVLLLGLHVLVAKSTAGDVRVYPWLGIIAVTKAWLIFALPEILERLYPEKPPFTPLSSVDDFQLSLHLLIGIFFGTCLLKELFLFIEDISERATRPKCCTEQPPD